MSLNVLIGFNPEALLAISELTAAIRSIGGTGTTTAATTTTTPAKTTAAKTTTAANPTPEADDNADTTVKWVDNKAKTFGTVADEAAFKALKKKSPNAVKATDAQYDKMVALKAEEEQDDDTPVPSLEDVMDAFGGYLPSDLDKAERAERAKFVKPLLARFGAGKASELPEEHRALAINLMLRKAAGQDIDPETDEFEEFEAEEESLVG